LRTRFHAPHPGLPDAVAQRVAQTEHDGDMSRSKTGNWLLLK
jgi:hypothetical protein